MRILHVVGARPNFMKIAPLLAALRGRAEQPGRRRMENVLVHTGQHYDEAMSALFFRELGIPEPDVNLEVGSASHAVQTAEIMKRFERVCTERSPTHVLVVGDVNSTIACALVAAKLRVPVIHVEAGLRSFDRRMPEEINRVLTDAISDLLFTTEQSANENLLREGIDPKRIRFVGNVMIDTLMKHRRAAEGSGILRRLGLDNGAAAGGTPFAVLTLHRAESVDDPGTLHGILDGLGALASTMPVIFPVHPRTHGRIEAFGLADRFSWNCRPPENAAGAHAAKPGFHALEPLGYLDFLRLMAHARIVATDSGGIQEETTILGVPCVTLRESTERPVTVSCGTNVVAGTRPEDIRRCVSAQLEAGRGRPQCPPLWDGRAAERIADILEELEDQG